MTKFREYVPLLKQTYYLPFIWALTWYAYWLFRDITYWHQMNITNISAVIISIAVIVSAAPIQNATHKVLTITAFQINKSLHWALTFLGLQTRKKTHPLSTTSPTRNQNHHTIQIEKPRQQITRLHRQKQEPEQRPPKAQLPLSSTSQLPLSSTSEQPLSSTNSCPKNVDYFTQKPRPKQTPEECLTCKNLITCVCQTDS